MSVSYKNKNVVGWQEQRYAFRVSELITYLSMEDPLYPGEFIGSGTVGNGCGKELNKWIKPGDVVELKVEGIGILRNSVERNKS
ncbi:MAG: fumarylacetoacetate hydrolase family protein [Proteobacteria bacterium]|nr:fumarylacetoacetate hydrolase family protein [Pseudomonadota bacterium]